MEVSGQLHALAALPPGKETRYPLDRTMGELHSRLDAVEKTFAYTGIRIPAIQPVASRCTD
jgi:hypothetical protein